MCVRVCVFSMKIASLEQEAAEHQNSKHRLARLQLQLIAIQNVRIYLIMAVSLWVGACANGTATCTNGSVDVVFISCVGVVQHICVCLMCALVC